MTHPLRMHAHGLLMDIFNSETKAINCEKQIYNWSVIKTAEVKAQFGEKKPKGKPTFMFSPDEPSWDSRHFRSRYKHKLLEVVNNLKRNPDIIKTVKAKDIPMLDPIQIWPEGPMANAAFKLRQKELVIESNKARMDEDYEGILKCRKCKSTRTEYTTLQTRSADEPASVFAHCLSCDTRWKFC
jgi:DNA-directed RNA polymerase subunit M/transcription elongation factor TFIIS